MSKPKLLSPMLNDFLIGDAISDHSGVRAYPAMHQETNDKYILKIVSEPSSENKLDALLLTGAYGDEGSALAYFKTLADDVVADAQILKQMSELEGFLAFDCCLMEEEEKGYDVYLLSTYRRSLAKQLEAAPLTQLGAANLGLDICAALTVARRAGYQYVDLKPENIFVTTEGEYKIGDIGFLRLDGLKYATLPDRYRSEYTAPEGKDPYAPLNDTMDVYALGLILYQVYNNNLLPEIEAEQQLPAPQYADYEMSEIILKACAADPAERWQSPVDMGQAIIGYMQRNGINDTPIIPQVTEPKETPAEEPAALEDAAEEVIVTETDDESAEEENAENICAEEQAADENAPAEEIPAHVDTADAADSDDSNFENMSFLDDVYAEESDFSEEEISYDQVSEEVSEILEQADDLANLTVPEPVVAPEPIEVPIPEPIVATEEESMEATRQVDLSEINAQNESADATEEPKPVEETAEKPARKRSHWLRNSIIILAILALLAGAAYVFVRYYFLPIDSIRVEGSEDRLTVYVDSAIKDELLYVECSDPDGTSVTAPVVDGKAIFDGLQDNTGYTVKVLVNGFHKLMGDASSAYSTPVQTRLLQFSAVTGQKAGSLIVGFSVDGPESKEWKLTYNAVGEFERSITFSSHLITVEDLTVGKEYTFELEPVDDLYVDEKWTMRATVSELVFAQNITVDEFNSSTLKVSWSCPDGAKIDTWTVRCYNDLGYNETVVTKGLSATFDGIDSTTEHTVEVIAAGMSVSQRIYVKVPTADATTDPLPAN